MRLLAISGSLREASHNTKLLRAAAQSLPPEVQVEVLDPEILRAIPAYDEDLDGPQRPAAVVRLHDAVAGADALPFC